VFETSPLKAHTDMVLVRFLMGRRIWPSPRYSVGVGLSTIWNASPSRLPLPLCRKVDYVGIYFSLGTDTPRKARPGIPAQVRMTALALLHHSNNNIPIALQSRITGGTETAIDV
jgi:hypothetical protein